MGILFPPLLHKNHFLIANSLPVIGNLPLATRRATALSCSRKQKS